MATAIGAERPRFHFLPTSAMGWAALGLLGVSIVLWFARVALAPAVPVTYLVVLIAAAVAGLVALAAVVLAAERGVLVVAAMLIGLIAGVWLVAGSMTAPMPLKLDASDNGATVTVRPGTDIDIALAGNPGTGYSWGATIGNAAVLKERSAATYEASSTALGAGGTYTFHYHTAAAGRSDLTLIYRRTWETGVAPLQSYRITIVSQ